MADLIPTASSLSPSGTAGPGRLSRVQQAYLRRKARPADYREGEEPEEEEEAEKGIHYVPWGVTSFADLDAAANAHEANMAIQDLAWQFGCLVDNIMGSDLVPGKAKALIALSSEFSSRVKLAFAEELKEAPAEEEKAAPAAVVLAGEVAEPESNFMVWKDAQSGLYRFAGVYSSKFVDDSRPPDILSSSAHRDFVARVHGGEAAWPDLYVWHLKEAVGKVDWLAYDDAGFPICIGYFYPKYSYVAEAIQKCEEPIGMSHGMPMRSIRRDPADPQVIVKYDSTEVSVLLRKYAANKWTGFNILKEDNSMAVIDEGQRAGLVKLLGTDMAQRFEQDLSELGKSLEAANILNKAQEETPASTPAEPAEEVKEAEVAGEPEAEKAEPETPAEVKSEPVADLVTKEILVQTVSEVVSPIMQLMKGQGDQLAQQGQLLAALVGRLEAAEASVTALKDTDAKKIADAAANTPPASLASLILGQSGAGNWTAVGAPEARLKSNALLAADGPQVTPPPPTGPAAATAGLTGISFLDQMLTNPQQVGQG